MLEQYSTNYCICQEDSAFFAEAAVVSWGGGFLRFRCPAGGVPSLSPAAPALNFLFLPPIPPPPSPAGKGEIQGYSMQGASPLASPGQNPRGTGKGGEPRTRRGLPPALPVDLAAVVLAGGLPCLSPADPAFCFPFCPPLPQRGRIDPRGRGGSVNLCRKKISTGRASVWQGEPATIGILC